MSRLPHALTSLCLLSLPLAAQLSTSAAAVAPAERAFPLVASQVWSDRAIQLVPDAGLLAGLGDSKAVILRGVPVPSPDGFRILDLALTRFHVISSDATWVVDGDVVGGRAELEAGHSLWRGRVVGEPDSSVYLAFTSTGSRGWIDRADGKSHLVSVPVDGDWERAYSVLVHESDPLVRDGAPDFACGVDSLGVPAAITAPDLTPPGSGRGRAVTSYECLMACETDYQFYQLFGSVAAATNYAVSIWGAVSERYFDACSTFITLPYLAIYSSSNDPWTSQDTGGSSGDLLTEFQAAWGGSSFPGNANLGHFLSGANLGGGVAWVDVLCNNDWGLAVSGNFHGQTNFPVPTQDGLNWDFYVTAHETGHNFGTWHTHDYCPTPIDQCAPPGAFGSCQTQQVCQVGTIMSYCHLCPGGVGNVQMLFHPTVAAVLQQGIQQSCATSYYPASATIRNGRDINPVGYTAVSAPELGTTWYTQVDLTTPGATASVQVIGGGGPALGPIVAIGEILIDVTVPFVAQTVGLGGLHWIQIPDDLNLLGQVVHTQAATFKTGSVQLQNALDLYLAY